MSFSLAIENGDLVQKGASFGIVYGIDKLVQDLSMWLTESYGGDIMHPELGSVLESYIGTIISPVTEDKIRSEVLRVLENYRAIQIRGLRTKPEKYSLSEILYNINGVRVSATYDAVSVMISISTAPPEALEATVNVTTTNA